MSGTDVGEERRLAAIMFTDMVGYTAMAQANEARALKLLDEHRILLRPIFAKHAGREVKTIGDAFLVEFSSALQAVRCAVEMQKLVGERNVGASGDSKVHMRVGIHVGEVVVSENDVYGDAVNVASRIDQLAEPGGVCLTQQVYDHIRNKTDLKITRLGPVELKNVKAPIGIYRIATSDRSEVGSTTAQMERKRVAVLPFSNISAEQSDEYIADGLTEELISTMSKVRELNVISRTSVMQYKGKAKSIPEIGRELNAGTILEGSVRKSGNRLRVSIQMIDALEDRHIWAENYDRELQDIFAMQSDIAARVADALKVELLSSDKKVLEEAPTKSAEAHTLYLKGIYNENKGAPQDIEKAIEYFKLAVDEDPEFALAYTEIAGCYIGIADESIKGSEAFPKAREYLAKALKLNDQLAEAHLDLALLAFQYDWNWAEAEKEFKKAIELNPNLAEAHNWYARFIGGMGRFDEAIEEMNRAQELDPVSPFHLLRFGLVYWIAGKNDKAREKWRKVLEIQPDSARAHASLGMISALESKFDEAVREAERAVEISDESFFRSFLAQVYALAGMRDKAQDLLKGLASGRYKGYPSPVGIGAIYYALGDKDRGFEWMRRGLDEHAASVPMTHRWPSLNLAREDPRYLNLLKTIGLQ
ncbi:MAG: tetratricopeptide repeat protein [Nitrososphaerales archaeon]|nr:tetratricopeptide repeat protein [Nitrososphaerales archaeon]